MQVILKPERKDWEALLQRPYADNGDIKNAVSVILDEVKKDGDEALRRFSKKWDGVDLDELRVTEQEIRAAACKLSTELKTAIQQAKDNIELFHKSQLIAEPVIETMPGIQCWRRSIGIEAAGLYVPGGTAPLFSTVLMLGIPAAIAGCEKVVLCTPAGKDGNVHPAILFTAALGGIKEVYKVGGAQAIGAMAYGTQSIPRVQKIFGPGNQYVTAAKQLVQQDGVAIDMPAGPSEVCILADETADASFIAADLLAQAEHGKDSQVILVTTDKDLIQLVLEEMQKQIKRLSRNEVIASALKHSKAILVKDISEGVAMVNAYAAEHLILICDAAEEVAARVVNAGSVFIGAYSPESVGDYASGTNHTLPTAGYAKAYSGVSVDSFVKKITYQKLTPQGLKNIGSTVIEMANAEGLDAHANAVQVRLSDQ